MTKQRTHDEEMADKKVEVSQGSVYAHLGFKDHKEMETKAILVMEIESAIKHKKLTQTAAAEILGISQPKLCELLRGQFRGYSVERLMHFLNELGKDVDIVIKPSPRGRKAHTSVHRHGSLTRSRKKRTNSIKNRLKHVSRRRKNKRGLVRS